MATPYFSRLGQWSTLHPRSLFKIPERSTVRPLKQVIRGQLSMRSASSMASPNATQYHLSKRAVHIGIPVLIAIFAILRFTDPSLAPQPPRKMMEELQGSNCQKIHASDLNKYIKMHPDEVSDEHTIGWNKMYQSFKDHRTSEAEPGRIEEENGRLLAGYARKEENKDRSTKEKGQMSTLSGNRNIGHRLKSMDKSDARQEDSFWGDIAARVAEGKRRLTKVTKGFV